MGENRNGWRCRNLSTFAPKRSVNMLSTMSRFPSDNDDDAIRSTDVFENAGAITPADKPKPAFESAISQYLKSGRLPRSPTLPATGPTLETGGFDYWLPLRNAIVSMHQENRPAATLNRVPDGLDGRSATIRNAWPDTNGGSAGSIRSG